MRRLFGNIMSITIEQVVQSIEAARRGRKIEAVVINAAAEQQLSENVSIQLGDPRQDYTFTELGGHPVCRIRRGEEPMVGIVWRV